MTTRLSDWFDRQAVPLGQVSTHWGIVLAAREATPDGRSALRRLAERYYAPVFATLRALGSPRDAALELTHQFMASFCEGKFLEHADPTRGSFRAFLKTCLRNFVYMEGRKASVRSALPLAEGSIEAADITPEEALDRELAWHCLQQASEAARTRLADTPGAWEALSRHDLDAASAPGHEALAQGLGMDLGSFRRSLYRARQIFKEEVCRILREEAGHDARIEDEVDWFLRTVALGPLSPR